MKTAKELISHMEELWLKGHEDAVIIAEEQGWTRTRDIELHGDTWHEYKLGSETVLICENGAGITT